MMMKGIGLLFCFLLPLFLSAQQSRIEKLDPQAFDAKMKHIRHKLLDLRNREAYELGCIEGAERIIWPGKDAERRVDQLKRYEPVYIYCNDGSHSENFATYLNTAGFSTVVILTGGFESWKKAGLRIVLPKNE
jgi:rhodanese-related sulfurtransferase